MLGPTELEVACELARQAGASSRVPITSVEHKAGGEIVTEADRRADQIIIDGLRSAFPDDALYTEESPDSPARLSARRVWIVDPIDSTSDYVAGGDEHSVSIGLAIDGRAVLGAVYNPTRDELVAGAVGRGVTLNGEPVHVSAITTLHGARITVSRKEHGRGLQELGAHTLVPISSMAYKLARVAAGLDDATVSRKPRKEWGTCAGVALVVAAGGGACLLDGREIRFNRAERHQELGMVAGPLAVLDALREAVVR